MSNFTVSSEGQFVNRIKQRQSKWVGLGKFSFTLKVPQDTYPGEYSWWYMQEFGVPPHDINPKNSKYLVFPGPEGKVFWDSVIHHPGFKASHSVTLVKETIDNMVRDAIRAAFAEGGADNPQILKEALLKAGETAKELIVESMAQTLSIIPREVDPEYPLQSGKLGGRIASQEFDRIATIVDTSG